MTFPIPTNLILGFLGVGKTTAILNLLKNKPEHETWAVLVNEFGEVGVDGELLANQGAFVREVPGGCMCCVAGLPMQIGLNRLIHQAKPDRLLIEPTGLGHPAQIIETLNNEHYRDVIRLETVLCLVDPRKLSSPKVLANQHFQDQVTTADVLVANKTDLCSGTELEAFKRWAGLLLPTKREIHHTSQGALDPAWLNGTHASVATTPPKEHHRHHHETNQPGTDATTLADQPWQMRSNEGLGHFSIGWKLHPDYRLDERSLLALARNPDFERVKGVVNTSAGWRMVNAVNGAMTVSDHRAAAASRLEIISSTPLAPRALDTKLKQLLSSSPPHES